MCESRVKMLVIIISVFIELIIPLAIGIIGAIKLIKK